MRSLAPLGAILLSLSACAQDAPEGWRFPASEELAEEHYRKDSRTHYAMVEADFNLDGYQDKAFLLKSKLFSGEALAVLLGNDGEGNWQVLSETNWGKKYSDVSLSMGISLASPGNYGAACAKGYYDCGPAELREIGLAGVAIEYFKFGSAASIWYWHKSTGSFKQVWISD